MEDISKDVLLRLGELSKRVEALEQELARLRAAEPEPLGEEKAIDLDALGDFTVELALESDPSDVASEAVETPPETIEEASIEENLPDTDVAIEMDLPSLDGIAETDTPLPERDEEVDLPPGGFDLFGEISLEEPPKERIRAKKAVLDAMTTGEAWRSDLPGPAVRDIRSGISLNDRVMFINSLFRKDSVLFQDTLGRMNAMDSLDDAVKYLRGTFPEWYWSSDVVYRFMMCVRRKIR